MIDKENFDHTSGDVPLKENEIETGEAIEFLAQRLSVWVKDSFKAKKGGYTETSVKPIEKGCNTIINDFKQKPPDCQKSPTAKSIATLLNDKTETPTLQFLAAVVLFKENIIDSDLVFFDLIRTKKAWEKFLETYADAIGNMLFTRDYLLYYWKHGHVVFAKFSASFDPKKLECASANISFYNYIDSKFSEVKNSGENTKWSLVNANDSHLSFFLEYKHWQYSHFIVSNANNFAINDVTFGVYATNFEAGKPPSCGVCMFVYYDNVDEEIKTLREKNAVPSYISSKLYNQTLGISKEELDQHTLIALQNATDYSGIRRVEGVYKSHHYRVDYSDESSEDFGLEVNVLNVFSNGQIQLVCDHDSYAGFLSFPNGIASRFVKCSLDLCSNERIYRLHLFLVANDKYDILEGVFSGWSTENKPFTSLIRLVRIAENLDGLNRSLLDFIPHHAISSGVFDAKAISFFNNKRGYLSHPTRPIELEPSSKKHILERYNGQFYLLSRYQDLGYYNKAKLEIKDGRFIVQYFGVTYKGEVQEIRYAVASQWYLFFNILTKVDGHHTLDYGGCYYFPLSETGLEQGSAKLCDVIKYLSGSSLRVNSRGQVVARKEYMVASNNSKAFAESNPKISFTDDQKLRFDVKDNQPGTMSALFPLLLHELRRRENNLFTIDASTNKTITHDTNYGNLYIDAFLFKVLHSADNTAELYATLVHGIIDTQEPSYFLGEIEILLSKITLPSNNDREVLSKTVIDLYEKIKNSHADPTNQILFQFFLDNIHNIDFIRQDQYVYPLLFQIVSELRKLKQ